MYTQQRQLTILFFCPVYKVKSVRKNFPQVLPKKETSWPFNNMTALFFFGSQSIDIEIVEVMSVFLQHIELMMRIDKRKQRENSIIYHCVM